MKRKKPLVSIIVVNHNGKRFLKHCLDSLCNLNYPAKNIEIIMVDNCSGDGSFDYVRKNYPQVKLIRNDVNNYSRANNLGINTSKGKYIALINNDTKATQDWLIEAVKVAEQDNAIGAVGSKILFMDGRIQSVGHQEHPNFYWVDRGFREPDRGQYSQIVEAPSLCGCSVLYRKKCLKEVGLFDEDLNMYLEDVDMSIRCRKKGWRLFYVPKSIAYHKFHGSGDEHLATFYCERNRLLLIAKHYPQKLADALFGKGYFTVLNNRNDLIKVLSHIFTKIIKHYNTRMLAKLLPSIFDSLNKILNLEKDYLIRQNDSLQNSLSQKDELLSQQDQKLSQKDELLSQQDQKLSQKDELLSQQDQQLSQKEQLLSQQDQQLNILLQQIRDRDRQLQQLRSQIHRMCNTKTYRYIDRPLWKVLAILSSLLKPFSFFRDLLIRRW